MLPIKKSEESRSLPLFVGKGIQPQDVDFARKSSFSLAKKRICNLVFGTHRESELVPKMPKKTPVKNTTGEDFKHLLYSSDFSGGLRDENGNGFDSYAGCVRFGSG